MINQQKAKEEYEAYLGKVKSDNRIIGIILIKKMTNVLLW